MNIEKLYTDLYAYSQGLEPNEATFVARQVQRGEKHIGTAIAPTMLANILIDLRAEMANNAAKASGTKALYNLVKAIDKRRAKLHNPPPLAFADGFLYACDGHMIKNPREHPARDSWHGARRRLD